MSIEPVTPLQPSAGVARCNAFRYQDGTVGQLEVGYWTLGELAADGANALLLCHGASGNRDWALDFCGAGQAFDPDRHFIVSLDLPGGGASSRRSGEGDFPARYGLRDLTNAVAMLAETLGIRSMAFCGPSLASLVGLDLAALHPDRVHALVLWNAALRSDGFASAIAEALCEALEGGGDNAVVDAVRAILPGALGREALTELGAAGRDALVAKMAADWQREWAPDELAARYRCVAESDVAALYGGEDALAARLRAAILWICSRGDLLMPIEPIRRFSKRVDGSRAILCPSTLGHLSTAAPKDAPERAFFGRNTARFLKAHA